MFGSFTPQARQTVVLAQDEARSAGHDWIGTEHLLLALVRGEGSLPRKVLGRHGLSPEAILGEVRSIVGDRDAVVSGHIPFTPRAKQVLQGSPQEAEALGQRTVDVGHLMLSLLHLEEGVGHQVLTGLGADLTELGRHLVRQMSEETP